MKFTKRQDAILLGTILGDAFIQKTGAKNARLRLEHGEAQKEYLLWKTAQFPRLFQGKPTHLSRVHPKSGKTYSYLRHQSNATPELGKWRARFYPSGQKRIPSDLSTILTEPLALAVWYMNDGYFYERDKVSYLYLGRVTEEEATIAQTAISENFGIDTTIYDKKKKGFALYFTVDETKKLHRVISNHMVPLFNYKLLSEFQTSP